MTWKIFSSLFWCRMVSIQRRLMDVVLTLQCSLSVVIHVQLLDFMSCVICSDIADIACVLISFDIFTYFYRIFLSTLLLSPLPVCVLVQKIKAIWWLKFWGDVCFPRNNVFSLIVRVHRVWGLLSDKSGVVRHSHTNNRCRGRELN